VRESGADAFDLESWIDRSGVVSGALELGSSDGGVKIEVPDGTVAVSGDGIPLSAMELRLVDEPAPLPSGHVLIGRACDLGPDGSTFDPPLSLTLQYEGMEIPAGVSEQDLVLAYLDDVTGVWVELESVVNTTAKTVTARVRHFTTFAVVGTLRQAAFSIGDMVVDPAEVTPGGFVTVTAEVTNTGGSDGDCLVTLEVDGVVEASRNVVLACGSSCPLTFTVSRDVPGSYEVRIGDSVGEFDVVYLNGDGTPLVLMAGGAGGAAVLLAALVVCFVLVRRRRDLSRRDTV